MMVTFPIFPLFPFELRELVWSHAANSPPSVHFFHSLDLGDPMSMYADLELIPDRQSAAHNLVNLLRTCHASRAAVLKRIKAIKNPTILRSPCRPAYPVISLHLDLYSDIVCPQSTGIPVEWAEYSHIFFTSARRFAVKCPAKWIQTGLRVTLCEHHDRWVPNPCVKICARCLGISAILLGKFKRLQYFYLLLDTPSRPSVNSDPARQVAHISSTRQDVEIAREGPSWETFHAYEDMYDKIPASRQAMGTVSTSWSVSGCVEDELVRMKPMSNPRNSVDAYFT